MATWSGKIIRAKLNTGSKALDVLDPNTWEGGEVPGPRDVAWFAGSHKNNVTLEVNNEKSYKTFGHARPDYNSNGTSAYPSDFRKILNGKKYFSSSVYTTQQGRLINSPGIPYYYTSNNSNNAFNPDGTVAYTYRPLYKDTYAIFNGGGIFYYWTNAYAYRVDSNNGAILNLRGEIFSASAEDGGYSGDNTILRREAIARALVNQLTGSNLTTGSADPFSADGIPKFKIHGPHNGQGYDNNLTGLNNGKRYFTISCFQSASNGQQVSHNWFTGQSDTNLTALDLKVDYISLHSWFTSSNAGMYFNPTHSADVIDEYNGPSGSYYDYNYNYPVFTGSGFFYQKTEAFKGFSGVGPGTPGTIKLNFRNMKRGGYFHSCSLDENFSTYSTSSFVDYSTTPPIQTDANGNWLGSRAPVNGLLPMRDDANLYNEKRLQKYELTGSQEWHVGQVRWGYKSHFHMKDNAKIVLHDLYNDSYYPQLLVGYGKNNTLLMTDRASLFVSSSYDTDQSSDGNRTTYTKLLEVSGINCNTRSDVSIILSGSQNYSSSFTPNAANSGDTSIVINNLTSSFGVGDYVTIESTGSMRVYQQSVDYSSIMATSSAYLTSSDINTNDDYWIKRNAYSKSYSGQQDGQILYTLISGSYNHTKGYSNFEFTHDIENDEIVQIISMSDEGNIATVAKMYGKEGRVQEDMGSFTFSQFVDRFKEVPSQNDTDYSGTKRAILVDSNHKRYEAGDKVVINQKAYNVHYVTTFLSQSKNFDFTQGTLSPEDVFDIDDSIWSGSSIGTSGSYNDRRRYYRNLYKAPRLLMTGSRYQGSDSLKRDIPFYNIYYGGGNQGYEIAIGGAGSTSGSMNTGSNAPLLGLRMDPTSHYYWNNKSNQLGSVSYHTQRLKIKNYIWDEGEITISGSLIRDGYGANTSSAAIWNQSAINTENSINQNNMFGIVWGETIYNGPHNLGYASNTNNTSGYSPLYPWMRVGNRLVGRFNFSKHYGGTICFGNGTHFNGGISLHKDRPSWSAANLLSYDVGRLKDPLSEPGFEDFPLQELCPIQVSSSDANNPLTPASAHLRMVRRDGICEGYIGTKGKEYFLGKKWDDKGRGTIGVELSAYGAIYSINVKQRYQLLLLDTSDSFSPRDKMKEGGLLYNHYPNKKVKFIATEVKDCRGFKNLLWMKEYSGPTSSIRPFYTALNYSIVKPDDGTPVDWGNTQWQNGNDRSLHPSVIGQYNANPTIWTDNADWYVILDIGDTIEFDTVGIIQNGAISNYKWETHTNNMIDDVSFQVSDDIGVASPTWTTVVASHQDRRKSTGAKAIRYYTFTSGSVNARYIKYKNRGGTVFTNYGNVEFFGIYNFSGSATNAGTLTNYAEKFKDGTYFGNPTSSLLQLELTNTKNFSVGDEIFVWNKQMSATLNMGKDGSNISTPQNLHGILEGTSGSRDFVGGIKQHYTITKIEGNVINIDRPLSFAHQGDGSMVWKFNRGGIELNITGSSPKVEENYAPNTATCGIDFDAYGAQCHLENVYMPHGKLNRAYTTNNNNKYTFVSDVAFYMPWSQTHPSFTGLVRNIMTNAWSGPMSNYSYDQMNQDTKIFNWFNTMDNGQSYAGGASQRKNFNRSNIINFFHHVYPANYRGISVGTNGQNVANVTKIVKKNIFAPYASHQRPFIVHTSDVNGQLTNNLITHTFENIRQIPGYFKPNQNGDYAGRINQPALSDEQRKRMNHNVYDTFYFPSRTSANHLTDYFSDNASALRGQRNFFGNMSGPRAGSILYPEENGRRDFGNKKIILLGKPSEAQITILDKDADGFHDILDISTAKTNNRFDNYANQSSGLNCSFIVTEKTEVRLDIDVTYKIPIISKYPSPGYNAQSNSVNVQGQSYPNIFLQDQDELVYDVIYFTKTTPTTINHSKTHLLKPGRYIIYFTTNNHTNNTQYNHGGYRMSLKNIDMKLVTSDLNKIQLINNNFDILKLFGSTGFNSNINNTPFTDNSGIARVLQQSNDLTKTVKFNKTKI